MDEAAENQNLTILKQFNAQRNFLGRTLQFLVSVTLLSLFLCFYSSGFPLFPNSFNVYFNTCLFSYLTNTLLSRKYMFLVCNGILALLAKCSLVSCGSSGSESAAGENLSTIASDLSVIEDATTIDHVEDRLAISTIQSLELEGAQEQEEKEEKAAFEEEEEEDNQGESGRETDLRGEEYESGEAMIPEDEGKGELANTEELNRRFEEFIKKMKEEIRIEARQQLIAV